MDSLLHILGLAYFIFMGAAALRGLEDVILPGRHKHDDGLEPTTPYAVLHSPSDAAPPAP